MHARQKIIIIFASSMLLVFISLGLLGALLEEAARESPNTNHVPNFRMDKICVENVTYYVTSSLGISPAYNIDGTLQLCGEKR